MTATLLNLRVSHYTESKLGGMVGMIVCFHPDGDGLINVTPGKMSTNSRTNEWNFGEPDQSSEDIWITAKVYTYWGAHFERFRPDLRGYR